jgi:SAM-dependent methyltransferase
MVEVEWLSSLEAAETYERVLVPALFDRWVQPILEAGDVGEGDRVLDVACGTGVVARQAVAVVGDSGHVVGVDIDGAMLDVARRFEPQVEWTIGDATELPFGDESFDVVVCQAGLMFFSDQEKAVGEMRRVLRADGRAVVQVWAQCQAQESFARLVEHQAGHRAANNYRTPWNLDDPYRLLALIRAGGFTSPEISTQQGEAVYPSVNVFLEGATGILVSSGLNTQQLKQDTTVALNEYIGPDGVLAFPEPAHIVTTTKT